MCAQSCMSRNGQRIHEKWCVTLDICIVRSLKDVSVCNVDLIGMHGNFKNLDTKIPNIYRMLRDDGGYNTMTTGKDDLSKVSGVGINGEFNAEALGFSQWHRMNDKYYESVSYPSPNDPYTAELNQIRDPLMENGTLYQQLIE